LSRTIIDKRGRAIEIETLDRPGVLRPKWERRHVQVPWFWVEQLRKVRLPSTHDVANVILYEYWRRGRRAFPLSNKKVSWTSRRTKWRALAELEALGLIAIERKPRQSPWITCYHVKT
jgi:hypothetical protein